MLHSIHGDQNDTNEQTHIRAEITTAGRNNEAIEQVVMRLSIENDVSTLSWSIIESAMDRSPPLSVPWLKIPVAPSFFKE
jgi:putative Mg2+ transporter-C (MgtC) family protein